MTLTDFLPAGITAGASFVGAWLAAQFALRRFYREKVWERKAAAYTAIFEALHSIEQWYRKHRRAEMKHQSLSDDEKSRLQKEANDAEADLERRLASETWLIPTNCRLRLKKLTSDLEHFHTTDWVTYLDTSLDLLRGATGDLRNMVHADLRLKDPWYLRMWSRLTTHK